MAFHSFVLYTPDGIYHFDTWSMNKQKDTCWLANAFEQWFKEERKPGGMLEKVKEISFWSDNGPPYHSGDWILLLLGLGGSGGYAETFSQSGITFIINVLIAGEGKGLCDTHFATLTGLGKSWTHLHGNKLRPETVPAMIADLEEQLKGTTTFHELPVNHGDTCKAEYSFKITKGPDKGLPSAMHSFRRNGDTVEARRYTSLGDWLPFRINRVKKETGGSETKRSADIDVLRHCAIKATARSAREFGRSTEWTAANSCEESGFGCTAGGRFISKARLDSPFSKSEMLCFDEATADVCGWVVQGRYCDGETPWWKPGKTATVHTCFKKLGIVEAIATAWLAGVQRNGLDYSGAVAMLTPTCELRTDKRVNSPPVSPADPNDGLAMGSDEDPADGSTSAAAATCDLAGSGSTPGTPDDGGCAADGGGCTANGCVACPDPLVQGVAVEAFDDDPEDGDL